MGAGQEAGVVNERALVQTSMVLKALSHPLRLKILCLLGDSGREVSALEIIAVLGTSQSNVSQHISIMQGKGVITTHKDGNRVMYSVSDASMLDLFYMMCELFCDD